MKTVSLSIRNFSNALRLIQELDLETLFCEAEACLDGGVAHETLRGTREQMMQAVKRLTKDELRIAEIVAVNDILMFDGFPKMNTLVVWKWVLQRMDQEEAIEAAQSLLTRKDFDNEVARFVVNEFIEELSYSDAAKAFLNILEKTVDDNDESLLPVFKNVLQQIRPEDIPAIIDGAPNILLIVLAMETGPESLEEAKGTHHVPLKCMELFFDHVQKIAPTVMYETALSIFKDIHFPSEIAEVGQLFVESFEKLANRYTKGRPVREIKPSRPPKTKKGHLQIVKSSPGGK